MPDAGHALDAIRATHPWWIGIAPLVLVPLALVLAWLGSFLGVSIALVSLRGLPEGAHWTERARRGWPARVVASGTPLLIGIAAGAAVGFGVGPLSLVPGAVVGTAAGIAAFAGAWTQIRRVERVVKGRSRPIPVLIGGQLFTFLTMIPHVLIVLGAAAIMPADPVGAGIGAAIVLTLLLLVALGFGLRASALLGLAWPADARLARIVAATARRVGVTPRRVWIVRWPMVNALALPRSGDLAFTEDAVASLTDAEIEAIAAHELGHLGEPASVLLARSLGLVALFPIALARPVASATGDPLAQVCSVWGLVVLALVVGRVVQRVARRMEERADAVAHAHEEDPGAYARALERIHELNLAPAVVSAKRPVHPHLYDRLVSAGVTPAYPRPAPPPRRAQTFGLVVALSLPVIAGAALHVGPVGETGLAIRGGSIDDLATIGEARWREGDLAGALPYYQALAALQPEEPFWPSEAARLASALGRCDEARAALLWAEQTNAEIGGDPAALEIARQEFAGCVPRE